MLLKNPCRGVAQTGSALEWGSRGRWFKSNRPDQLKQHVTVNTATYFLPIYNPVQIPVQEFTSLLLRNFRPFLPG
jgi:hypothetical protein